VKSVQEFKSKNEYEIITANTQINNFNDFNEIFYCDCKNVLILYILKLFFHRINLTE